MKILLTIVSIFFIFGCGTADKKIVKKEKKDISPLIKKNNLNYQETISDSKYFFKLLEQTHPDPYSSFGGKIYFKRKVNNFINNIPKKGLSKIELENRLQKFLSPLKDGHTKIFQNSINWWSSKGRLNLKFKTFEKGFYLTATDYENFKDLIGAQLVSVNGLTIEKILEKLDQKKGIENDYHGYIFLKNILINPEIFQKLTDNSPIISMRYEFKTKSNIIEKEIKIKDSNSKNIDQWRYKEEKIYGIKIENKPFYTNFYKDGDIGYLRVADMMPRESFELAKAYNWGDPQKMVEWYFKKKGKKINKSFDKALKEIPSFWEVAKTFVEDMKINKTKTMIIDLQNNGGGVTHILFPFLYYIYGDKFFRSKNYGEFITNYSPLMVKKYNKNIDQIKKELNNQYFEIGDYHIETIFKNGKEYRKNYIKEIIDKNISFSKDIKNIDGKEVYQPKKVIVLLNEQTFSAGFHFAYYLKQLGAIVVGVPSGQAPNSFMEITKFNLPISNIKGSISNSYQLLYPNKPNMKVLKVDYPIDYKIIEKYQYKKGIFLKYVLDNIEDIIKK